jgi:hypothetical protein
MLEAPLAEDELEIYAQKVAEVISKEQA